METITILKSEYQALLNSNKELLLGNKALEDKVKILEEKILDLHQRLFGKKKDLANKSKKTGIKPNNSSAKGNRGRKPIDKSEVDYTKSYDFETTPVCSSCNSPMSSMGSNNSYHQDYKVVIQKVKVSQAKYVCRCCNIITIANGSRLPIRKGTLMPGFLAKIILDKFSAGLPCYRQAQNYGYSNHNYTRQMLCNLGMQAADLLTPLVELILFKMLQTRCLASDETGIVLLNLEGNNSGSKAYMCVLKQAGEKFNFVYCWAIKSRRQDVINGKLKDFKGYLQSDGLNFYFKLKNKPGIKLVNCWAHARRKFVSIIKLSHSEEGVAFNVVEKIDALYKIEQKVKVLGLDANRILELREEESIPILEQLKSYLELNFKSTPPKSKLGIAINYVLERWEALNEYTKDPILDIDNNHTERCIKFIVIGRKGWLFADNIESANKLGVLYSLIISCKINNINPKTYLEYVLTQMPYINKNDPKYLEQLLPDRFNLNKRFDQEYLRSRKIVEKIIYHAGDTKFGMQQNLYQTA
jgi:transposase